MPKTAEGAGWLGAPAAAKRLGVGLRTLYGLIEDEGLPAYRFGRVIRIRAQDLEAFLERSRIKKGDLAHLVYPGRPEEAEDGASETDAAE